MSALNSCLFLILSTASQAPLAPPPEVASLMKSRLKHQYEARFPEKEIFFDHSPTACSHRGEYSWHEEHLEIHSETLLWPGKRSFRYSTLLEGRKLDFPPGLYLSEELLAKSPISTSSAEIKPTTRHWVWGLLAVGLGTAGYFIWQKTRTPGQASPRPASTPAPKNSPRAEAPSSAQNGFQVKRF